ncbi:MAG: LysR substrate-binding domain-containing protein, partial [Caulobacterales bacterium]|nr:LysR substrate-binding domain-containing protein [Caulobacterales bacterium]
VTLHEESHPLPILVGLPHELACLLLHVGPGAKRPISRASQDDHPHIIIAPPDHRFAARKRLTFADLASETFLLREPGSGTRALLERLLADAGIEPRVGMEIGSNETIKQAVMAGIGIAFLSAHTVAREIADERLAMLPVRGTPIVRQWILVKLAERRLLPAPYALWRFLAANGAKFLPETTLTNEGEPS